MLSGLDAVRQVWQSTRPQNSELLANAVLAMLQQVHTQRLTREHSVWVGTGTGAARCAATAATATATSSHLSTSQLSVRGDGRPGADG